MAARTSNSAKTGLADSVNGSISSHWVDSGTERLDAATEYGHAYVKNNDAMPAKKAPTIFRPNPKAAQAAQELRARTNALGDSVREALFNRGMQMIYGGSKGSKTVSLS